MTAKLGISYSIAFVYESVLAFPTEDYLSKSNPRCLLPTDVQCRNTAKCDYARWERQETPRLMSKQSDGRQRCKRVT